MTIHESSKHSKFQRLYEFEKLSEEPSLSIGKIAYFSTSTNEDKDLLAWELFVDCCLNKIEHEVVRPIATFEKDLLSGITETTIPNPLFSPAYRHYKEYNLRTYFFISKAAYYYWAINSKYWSELKDNDFICSWLKDIIIEHDFNCAWLKDALAEIEQQPASATSCEGDIEKYKKPPSPNSSDNAWTTQTTDSDTSPTDNTFKLYGDSWIVRYNLVTKSIRDNKGMHYIAHLLRNKNNAVFTVDLYRAVNPPAIDFDSQPDLSSMNLEQLIEHGLQVQATGNQDYLLDGPYLNAIKKQRNEIKDQIDLHQDLGNSEEANYFQTELDNINTLMSSSINHKGGSRSMPNLSKKSYDAVSKAIRITKNNLKKTFPELALHLDKHIKMGAFFIYQPSPDTDWTLPK